MQQRWVALLRAVNLAGRNRVPMAELRELCVELGFDSVQTYIASGNVVFTTERRPRDALRRELEDRVAERFGVASKIAIRTSRELRELLAAHPFGTDTSNTMVSFLVERPTAAAIREVHALAVAPDEVRVRGSDVFLLYPNGVNAARLSTARLERKLGVPGTARTWRTVAKLAELASAKPRAT